MTRSLPSMAPSFIAHLRRLGRAAANAPPGSSMKMKALDAYAERHFDPDHAWEAARAATYGDPIPVSWVAARYR
jgi:hypothetical protein